MQGMSGTSSKNLIVLAVWEKEHTVATYHTRERPHRTNMLAWRCASPPPTHLGIILHASDREHQVAGRASKHHAALILAAALAVVAQDDVGAAHHVWRAEVLEQSADVEVRQPVGVHLAPVHPHAAKVALEPDADAVVVVEVPRVPLLACHTHPHTVRMQTQPDTWRCTRDSHAPIA